MSIRIKSASFMYATLVRSDKVHRAGLQLNPIAGSVKTGANQTRRCWSLAVPRRTLRECVKATRNDTALDASGGFVPYSARRDLQDELKSEDAYLSIQILSRHQNQCYCRLACLPQFNVRPSSPVALPRKPSRVAMFSM